MAWYLKYYRHRDCNTRWTDEWSCACNDHCPDCNAEIEPYDWDDLSVLVEGNSDGTWTVLVSPISAEHKPRYQRSDFDSAALARKFATQQKRLLRKQLNEGLQFAHNR
jgi:hypothetical protein